MDNVILGALIAGCSIVLSALLIIGATIVGGWLLFKGNKGNASSEPFIGKSTPGAYAINVDGQDFPEQKTNKSEEHVLKKTESFLRSLGGGK